MLVGMLHGPPGQPTPCVAIPRSWVLPLACAAGEVGIDDALVLTANEEVFEMNNGRRTCWEVGAGLGALM